jgi:hypothetical protein
MMKQINQREEVNVPLWDARHPGEGLEGPFPIPLVPRDALMKG